MKKKTPPSPTGATEVRLELKFHASRARVWQALVKETGAWWPKSFYAAERARFVIEPKLGGMMGEVGRPGEGLVWYRVIGVEKPNYLLFAGHLVPPWAGPASTLLRLALHAISATETKLELTDSTFGKVGENDNEAGWRQILDEHLRPHLEKPRARKK